MPRVRNIADQQVREILTDAGARVECVDDGGLDLRGALLITEAAVDLMGGGFGKAQNRVIRRGCFGLRNEGDQGLHVGGVIGGYDEIVEIISEVVASCVKFLQGDSPSWRGRPGA